MKSTLKEFIKGAGKVCILAHTHPDGDALGSCVGMAEYLKSNFGKEVVCIVPDRPGQNILFIIPSGFPFIFADERPKKADKAISSSDLIILLDCNSFSRTEALAEKLRQSRARKVLIDHHLNPCREEFDLVISTTEISSASELVYWTVKEMGGDIPEESRCALLAGMTTDTNNFSNSVFPSTFAMASEIIASGTDRDAILSHLYNEYRENRIRLMGYMQSEKMVITPQGAAYMIMTEDILNRYNHQEGETEGLVNVPLAIGKVRMSILLTQKDGLFRVSVRSKKGTSAQGMVANWFNGGGHENAAGGKLIIGKDIDSPEEAEAYVRRAIESFLG